MTCRLCLNIAEEYFGFFETEGLSMNAASIVGLHFWFEPQPDDILSNNICKSCWTIIESFHSFYMLVKNNHKILIKTDSFDYMISKQEKTAVDSDNDNDFISQIDYLPDPDDDFEDIKPDKEVKPDADIETTDNVNEESKEKNTDNNRISTKDIIETKILKKSNESKTEEEHSSKKPKRGRPTAAEIAERKKKASFGPKTSTTEKKEKKFIFFTDEQVAQIRTLNCNNCSIRIATFSELKKHMEDVHDELGYAVCCDKKFYKRFKFVNHLRMHINPEEFKCPHCDKRLGSKKYIKLHIKNMHTEVGKMKKFTCDQCDKTFAQKAYLERHKLGHIPDSEKHHACEICGNRFPTPALLRVHTLNVHESRHSAICDLCGKKYKSPADLKRHRLEHDGIHEPKVQCGICGDWLSNKYKLKRHMLKHTTSDVEHRCPECNKVSANLLALKSHMRLHVAVRKFQCNVCEKVFRRSLNLREHMTTHTGEALYSCPNCPRTFTHHSNLHHHRKKMHPKELEEDRKLKDLRMANYNKMFGTKTVDESGEVDGNTNKIILENEINSI